MEPRHDHVDGADPDGPEVLRARLALLEAERRDLEARLAVAERRRALAEAKLAISEVAVPARWAPPTEVGLTRITGAGAIDEDDTPFRLDGFGPALDVLFHTALVGLVLCHTDSTILRANQRYAELVGRRLAELPGTRIIDLTEASDRPLTAEVIARHEPGRYSVKRYLRPDGTVVPALVLGWPLVDDDGRTVCQVGVALPLAEGAVSPATYAALVDALPTSNGSPSNGSSSNGSSSNGSASSR